MKNSLIINFSQETLEILNKEKYTLCCFLACKSENTSSFVPLCWSVTKFFLRSVLIEWEFNLSAYFSTSEIVDNKIIFIPKVASLKSKSLKSKLESTTGSNYQIALEQRMLIGDDGKVDIDTENTSETVLIQNDSKTAYSTGICIFNYNDKQYYGNCVFKTYNGYNVKVAPVNKAYLMFTSKDTKSNTVILKSENPGMLVDFTTITPQDNSRTVFYDISSGWSANGQVWGKKYPSGTDLKSILVSQCI
jgi:hypothetical protein